MQKKWDFSQEKGFSTIEIVSMVALMVAVLAAVMPTVTDAAESVIAYVVDQATGA